MKTLVTLELYDYALSIAKPEHEILGLLRQKTSKIPGCHMQISVDQGQFMAILAKILGAQKYLEIGVFTGYSALAVTLAMSSDEAKTYALDINPDTMEIAKEYWQRAKVEHKIIPMIGDALGSLNQLIQDNQANTFDLAFIDAKKADYISYFEYSYQLVKSGGIILIDNVFMNGEVLNTQSSSIGTKINQFNLFLKQLNLDYCVTTIADGLTIVRKT